MGELFGPLAGAAKDFGGWIVLFITLTAEAMWFRKQLSGGDLLTRATHETIVDARVGQYRDRCTESERREEKYLDLLLQQTPAFRKATEALVEKVQ